MLISIPCFAGRLQEMQIAVIAAKNGAGDGESIETLRPTSDLVQNWTPSSGTDHYALVDESAEDTADYLRVTNFYKPELFDIPNVSVSSGKTINSVTIKARVLTNTADATDFVLRAYISGTSYDSSNFAAIGTSYGTVSYTWLLNPRTSSAWTSADIDSSYWGFMNGVNAGGSEYRVSQFWVEINYVP